LSSLKRSQEQFNFFFDKQMKKKTKRNKTRSLFDVRNA
jgi:hypothetical protein